MKLANFASFDPNHQSRGVKGLGNVSEGDRQIWNHYLALDVDPIEVPTEAVRETKVWRVQHRFRQHILENYQEQCCICGIPIPKLLVASHIIPWSEQPPLRLAPTNGLCLCAIHDRAYETGLLGITPDYRIEVSSEVDSYYPNTGLAGVFGSHLSEKIRQPIAHAPAPEYLEYRYASFRK
jgi:putative restriction endonuclease